MARVSFELVQKNDDTLIKTANTLKEIWWFIKTHINEPRNYEVDELNDGELADTTTAYYLIENYKTEESLPACISDINDNI